MARNLRQSKILELIKENEIETQEELVSHLRALNFDITQATISRDIKELGLIKIMTESKKYKYAYIDSTDQQSSNKYTNLAVKTIVSILPANNLVVVKTLKGFAMAVGSSLDKQNFKSVLGIVWGDDTVLLITRDAADAMYLCDAIRELL